MCNQVGQVLVLRGELPLAADFLFPELVGLLCHPVIFTLLVKRCKGPNREPEYDDNDATDGYFFVVAVFIVVVAIDGVPHGAGTFVEVGVLPRNQDPLSKLFFSLLKFVVSFSWFPVKLD
jgi:hypothetical protein